MLLKGDELRLNDGQTVQVLEVWGIARCHAKVKGREGNVSLIIAERDVQSILRRPAVHTGLRFSSNTFQIDVKNNNLEE